MRRISLYPIKHCSGVGASPKLPGANRAMSCLSPARNSFLRPQLCCSCVCRQLFQCSGQGWRMPPSTPYNSWV